MFHKVWKFFLYSMARSQFRAASRTALTRELSSMSTSAPVDAAAPAEIAAPTLNIIQVSPGAGRAWGRAGRPEGGRVTTHERSRTRAGTRNDGITSYTTEPATTGTRGPSKRGALDISASNYDEEGTATPAKLLKQRAAATTAGAAEFRDDVDVLTAAALEADDE